MHRRLRRAAPWVKRHELVQRPLRAWARATSFRQVPGVTVVIVAWEALPFLRIGVDAVRRFSPDSVRVLVVDNGSKDGTGRWLRSRRDVSSLRLPANVGHGLALDLGFLVARTEYVVALDVDAFPFSDAWLDAVIGPLRRGARVSGAAFDREFAHPCFLAMRRLDFVSGAHSFVPRYQGELGLDGWDVGERISMRERPSVALVPVTSVRGPGPIGTVYGDVVYHNFYGTRHLLERDADAAVLDGAIRRADARAAWQEATTRWLALPTTGE